MFCYVFFFIRFGNLISSIQRINNIFLFWTLKLFLKFRSIILHFFCLSYGFRVFYSSLIFFSSCIFQISAFPRERTHEIRCYRFINWRNDFESCILWPLLTFFRIVENRYTLTAICKQKNLKPTLASKQLSKLRQVQSIFIIQAFPLYWATRISWQKFMLAMV